MEDIQLNNLDVAGLLRTYAEKCAKARDDEHLKDIIMELNSELNSKKINKLKTLK